MTRTPEELAEMNRAKQRRWRQRHPDANRDAQRRWRAAHLEEARRRVRASNAAARARKKAA